MKKSVNSKPISVVQSHTNSLQASTMGASGSRWKSVLNMGLPHLAVISNAAITFKLACRHSVKSLISPLLTLGTVAGLLTACGGMDEKSGDVTEDAVKQNHVDIAYATYTDSLQTAKALEERVAIFIADPSEENLASAKAAYKQTRVPYQQSEVMRWDTAITIEAELASDGGPESVDAWEGQVNAWPLDENHIVAIIKGGASINVDLLLAQNGAEDNEANVTTGVHAVEFMLWGADTHGTDAGAGERPASDFAIGDACVDAYCQRRSQYLQAAMRLWVSDLEVMQAEWSPEAKTTSGTLAYNFLNHDLALSYMLGAIRAMASDELASARMGSGLELGDPEEEHDCFSDLSHIAIYNNFQGVRNAFYGSYNSAGANNVSGPSIGALIKLRDLGFYNRIHQALTDIEKNMAELQALGEREQNPIRFDQIIGQAADGEQRILAETTVDKLIALDGLFQAAQELLSITEIETGGSGD